MATTTPRWWNPGLAGAFLVTAALVCGGMFSPESAAAGVSRTTVKTLHVYEANGKLAPGIRVTRTTKGHCWTGSDEAKGAYRCFIGNVIYDPCFAHTRTAVSVVCVENPWDTRKAVRIKLTKKLPTLVASSYFLPWAFELATGVRCILNSGTSPQIDKVPMYFYCLTRPESVAGGLDRSKEPWTAKYAKRYTSHTFKTEVVATVWN